MRVPSRSGSLISLNTTSCLSCIACGTISNILSERAFRCATCDNLLEIRHQYDGLDQPMVERLKDRFRSRAAMYGRPGHAGPRERSGVWRFHELIMPNLSEDQLVTLGEGIVPIVPAGNNLRKFVGGDIDIWIILEGKGPSGSFKDFGGAAMMSVAKAAGVKKIACASTGDTSAMLAAYAAAAGLECSVMLPRGMVTPSQLIQPGAYGARVLEIPGDFDDCMRILRELVERHGVYPGNSLNPARIEGHQATVFLIAEFFRWILPEWIVVPVGNGSNSSSIGKGMRLLKDHGFVDTMSRILGCQTEAANPLARSWESLRGDETDRLAAWRNAYRPMKAAATLATATQIGAPVSREKVMREITYSDGAMQTVNEQLLYDGMLACCRDGHLVCPQTGIAIAGLKAAVEKGLVTKGQTAVIVSTADGLKFGPVFESEAAKRTEQVSDTSTATVAKMLGL